MKKFFKVSLLASSFMISAAYGSSQQEFSIISGSEVQNSGILEPIKNKWIEAYVPHLFDGLAAWKSGVISYIRHYGPGQDAAANILRAIFNNDGAELDYTRSRDSVLSRLFKDGAIEDIKIENFFDFLEKSKKENSPYEHAKNFLLSISSKKQLNSNNLKDFESLAQGVYDYHENAQLYNKLYGPDFFEKMIVLALYKGFPGGQHEKTERFLKWSGIDLSLNKAAQFWGRISSMKGRSPFESGGLLQWGERYPAYSQKQKNYLQTENQENCVEVSILNVLMMASYRAEEGYFDTQYWEKNAAESFSPVTKQAINLLKNLKKEDIYNGSYRLDIIHKWSQCVSDLNNLEKEAFLKYCKKTKQDNQIIEHSLEGSLDNFVSAMSYITGIRINEKESVEERLQNILTSINPFYRIDVKKDTPKKTIVSFIDRESKSEILGFEIDTTQHRGFNHMEIRNLRDKKDLSYEDLDFVFNQRKDLTLFNNFLFSSLTKENNKKEEYFLKICKEYEHYISTIARHYIEKDKEKNYFSMWEHHYNYDWMVNESVQGVLSQRYSTGGSEHLASGILYEENYLESIRPFVQEGVMKILKEDCGKRIESESIFLNLIKKIDVSKKLSKYDIINTFESFEFKDQDVGGWIKTLSDQYPWENENDSSNFLNFQSISLKTRNIISEIQAHKIKSFTIKKVSDTEMRPSQGGFVYAYQKPNFHHNKTIYLDTEKQNIDFRNISHVKRVNFFQSNWKGLNLRDCEQMETFTCKASYLGILNLEKNNALTYLEIDDSFVDTLIVPEQIKSIVFKGTSYFKTIQFQNEESAKNIQESFEKQKINHSRKGNIISSEDKETEGFLFKDLS